jgi:outer membrane protein assembly factor BamB
MYRDGDTEVAIALRSDDGETLWEHRYDAPARDGHVIQFGTGPNATPLLMDDHVITLGYAGALICLDRASGEVVWSHSLLDEFGGEILEFGYSASPISHDGTVVVLVGGERFGALALDPSDGTIAWATSPSSVSYATPIVIDLEGQDQLVYFTADEIVGAEVGSGEKLWSYPVVNQYRNNATGPLWGLDRRLWVATQLDGGTRVLRLERGDGGTSVDESWSSDQLSVHFWNTLRIDDTVYASVGGNGSVLAAVDVTSGEILWRERGFEKVNFLHTFDRTVLLDADGHLALAALSPEGIEIRSQARILEGPSWTAPTLFGTTLFVRDRETIRALDLGATTVSESISP